MASAGSDDTTATVATTPADASDRHINMTDLLCLENIRSDTEKDFSGFNACPDEAEIIHPHKQQQQQQTQQSYKQQQQQQNILAGSSATSPCSNSSSSMFSLNSSSSSSSVYSSSSGYNSTASSVGGSNSGSATSNCSCATCQSGSSCCGNPRQQSTFTSASSVEEQSAHYAALHQQNQQQQQQQQQQPTQQQQQGYPYSARNRTLENVNVATVDPTFLTDRCLENALKAEEKRPHPGCAYFKTVQKDITPPMRKIVAEWMMEVCAEEKCQEEVVLLALNYMDRFLSTKSVRKTHLQILAAACLLLASKLREPSCRALSAELLVFYTDNSIYKDDLIKWELFVLSRLGWDLSLVTPLDFLELLLIRLPIRNTKCPDVSLDKVRQHAQAFISLAAKEHDFSRFSASTIAASSIAAALSGLNWHLRTGHNLRHLLNTLTDLTSVEQDNIHKCMKDMERTFEEHSRTLQPYLMTVEVEEEHQLTAYTHTESAHQFRHLSSTQQQHYQQCGRHHSQHQAQSQYHHGCNNTSAVVVAAAGIMLPDLTQTCKMQANAQKDVQDLKF